MLTKIFYLLLAVVIFIGPSISIAQNCGITSLNNINNPGPYTYSTLNQNSGIRNGPQYGDATIYHPTNANSLLPSVAIVPGFLASQSSVAAWGPFLASHGIVAIIFDTNSIFDPPADRAVALLDALETIKQENTRNASPLFGNLDTSRLGVMGWSMGGGGAQLAAAIDPSLKAVIALCPWLSTPTSSDLNHPVPVLIFSGELDPTAPPAIHADLHYALTPNTTDKLLFEVNNGNHSVANNPMNVSNEIGQYGLSWLRYYLQEDPCHCPMVLISSSNTSQSINNVVCPNSISCPQELYLFNTVLNNGNYKAINSVSSMGTVPSNDAISLEAEQYIMLNLGFNTELGAELEINIETCQ